MRRKADVGYATAMHVGGLKPRADQHQIHCARRQQCDRQCHMHLFTGDFEVRSHKENIRRFYFRSLADYFSPDSGLVYDSGTRGEKCLRECLLGQAFAQPIATKIGHKSLISFGAG
jgi:hypothetical protein